MWPERSINKSIRLMTLISKSVNACWYVVAFTNKMPCEASVSELLVTLITIGEKCHVHESTSVVAFVFEVCFCIEILISSEPITRQCYSFIITVCFLLQKLITWMPLYLQ